ncbi:preprotein translocase subunit SecY [Hornefia butyriciproducens]|uniref:Protein translocase subunit SecY n=1 Tax=Hornefia butyriciproducens TaxID=2652293 RepID=A0A6L5Y6L9_9FIRM|nr:preprotein translocase subunit SecY [Hornefia butyriciproducens]MCI7327701.1 preprotein translocase subunit SecY [Clostridiales bacterium]MCI7412485.1 preprotein translocase subunit SecY [Clostridiales bacterium]MCI7680309.1 preprotein translocase subunit SecY [Clostridiales bacterium]MDD6299990.1 preprotein translocase subunit SecY [Hornefia butyriciproducens]MDD7019188.1 preprotein translocase subunit SecY [Hornefia butyriciproducens]
MFKTISQALKVKEIRGKLIFTLLMLVVFRIGSNIPVPGINRTYLAQMFSGDNMGLFELFNLFSGGSFNNFTIFALSITPYITASIIIQLLTIAFPYFERLAKEGMEGRKKMAQITRYLTVALALVQGLGLTVGLFRKTIIDQNWFTFVVITLILTAGTTFLMWLGEQINEYGIGNGISLLIFGGIVARIPSGVASIWNKYSDGSMSIITVILFIVFGLLVIMGVIEIQQGTRRIPVQYAKRVVGRKMYGGQSTHIPLKVNQAGVIPIIFALSILQFPLTIMYFFPNTAFYSFCEKYLSPGGNPGVWVYAVLNVLLIIFFNYFYTAVTFNPVEVAQNMKANGGFIPGIRPGKATVEYLNRVMSRISIVGALFLAVIATMPTVLSEYTGLDIRFGGTSLLIAVGVALDTMRQLENQMVMRNYQGFLK